MSYTLFPENFAAGEKFRSQIIHDILFAPIAPSIEDVLECMPKPALKQSKSWTNDLMSWDSWSVGPIGKAYEIRNGENKSGWGGQSSHQRGMIENHMYETVKEQNRIIEEQSKQIKELANMMDAILVKHPRLKDEWIDIEENVTMI